MLIIQNYSVFNLRDVFYDNFVRRVILINILAVMLRVFRAVNCHILETMVVCVFVKHIREVITYETSLLCYIATHVKLQAYLNITNQTNDIYPTRTYFSMIIERNLSNYMFIFFNHIAIDTKTISKNIRHLQQQFCLDL